MSASLVGSEMCIRDSWKGASTTTFTEWLAARVSQCGMHPNTVNAHASVSYTHLTLPTICSV
eukprot:252849-Alexandrium_andersonii.AAC.1